MSKRPSALVIGANGQDGSYAVELLIEKGYDVVGTARRNSVSENQSSRLNHVRGHPQLDLRYMDLTDPLSVDDIISSVRPDEIYHLGAQSHVRISFDLPKYTLDVNAGGTLAVLESVRKHSAHSRVFHAATSEMFGNNQDADGYQRESTAMHPVSPYGCSKLYAHTLCNNYRNAYGLFVCSGIMFNHESPRRGLNFVTNKVVHGAVSILRKRADRLVLGNLDACRDWGHARDYVRGMWMMLQQDRAQDHVLATGISHSVHDLVKYVFARLGLDVDRYLDTDTRFQRPEELQSLRGDASGARQQLGWQPTYTFESLPDEMIDFWLQHIH